MCCDGFSFGSCEELVIVRVRRCGFSQRLKSLRQIRVRNCGFSEFDFFVVCEDIWIAICPFFVVVIILHTKGSVLLLYGPSYISGPIFMAPTSLYIPTINLSSG